MFKHKENHHRNHVGQILGEKKQRIAFSLCLLFCFALRKRFPFGNLFSTTFVLAHGAESNSRTTLPPHVDTSLQPLF